MRTSAGQADGAIASVAPSTQRTHGRARRRPGAGLTASLGGWCGRRPGGFVGLKNAGATCYMNAVFQQLFMQPSIRALVLGAREAPPAERDASVFHQLQARTRGWRGLGPTLPYPHSEYRGRAATGAPPALRLQAAVHVGHWRPAPPEAARGARQTMFGALALSNQDHFRPEGFWRAFKDYDGEPINVREHQDAYEFFTRLQARAAASCTRVSRPERAARASPSTCASTRTMPLRATAPRARAQDLVNQPHCAS